MSTLKVNTLENLAGTSSIGVDQLGLTGYKNLLINPHFDVDQRVADGVSTTERYTADRWRCSANANVVIEAKNFSDDDRAESHLGFLNSSGSTQTLKFLQIVEGSSFLRNEDVTFTLFAHGEQGVTPWEDVACDYTLSIVSIDKDTSPTTTNVTVVHSQAFTGVINGDITSITTTLPTTQDLWYGVMISAAIDDDEYFLMQKSQFEIGTKFTDWEYRPVALEESLCQRYYWRGYTDGKGYAGMYGIAGNAYMGSGFSFPTTMRVLPTITILTAPVYSNCTTYDIHRSKDGFMHRLTVSGTGFYRAYNGLYDADAEI